MKEHTDLLEIKVIARIENNFVEKFGIPRQSDQSDLFVSRIVFEPEYRVMDALRGIEDYDWLWIIWGFSGAVRDSWSPTVRPPRLGGNTRMGVFATRSPFRPNPLGLTSVRLDHVERDPLLGPVLYVYGADMMNGTPIYDIKPYLAYTDSHPDARGGFTDKLTEHRLQVDIKKDLEDKIPSADHDAVLEVLASDPRPRYHKDPDRIYGFTYGKTNIRFRVNDNILTVIDIGQKD